MIFYKTVASGNDFLYMAVEDIESRSHLSKDALAIELCHRRNGAGADGIVYYRAKNCDGSKDLPIGFEVFNRDGSEAEISGNGMAGLTALMFYLGVPSPEVKHLTLTTKLDLRTHHLLHRDDTTFRLNVEIGLPDFEAVSFFPFLEPGKTAYPYEGLTLYPVSVGNPHVVVLLKEEPEKRVLKELGRKLEKADIFPYGSNIEFVMETTEGWRVFFFERGVGHTLASSTGSAAVFAVLRHQGKVTDALKLHNGIKISGKNTIFIENSVKIVYKGIYKKPYSG